MLELKVLVCKGFGAVDGGAAGAVAVKEITALNHKVGDLRHRYSASYEEQGLARSSISKARKYESWWEEVSYHTMKLAPLVPLRSPQTILRLARAELAEILGGAGDDMAEQFDLDAAKGLT